MASPAPEVTSLPSPPAARGPGSDDLSLDQMLRILDAASELRRDREAVAEQLNAEQLRSRLRERLQEAAAASGNPLKPDEIDRAIDEYYARLHAYGDPPLGPEVVLAHLYVRRKLLASILVGTILSLTGAWFLFLRPSAPLTITGRTQKALARAESEFERLATSAESISVDPAANEQIAQLRREEQAARELEDLGALERARSGMAALHDRLQAEYTVEVVHEPGQQSGTRTGFKEGGETRVAGTYLIVEARGRDGRKVSRRIRNEERNTFEPVEVWAERVPPEVYGRTQADKKADGRLDEFVYAVKRKGKLEDEVVMKGVDGQPLRPLGQITEW